MVSRRAFTLVDVLVSIAVIAVLIGIMIPAISKVRTVTHRVMCSSNVRQLGLGIQMYADDHRDVIPTTRFSTANERDLAFYRPQNTVLIKTAESGASDAQNRGQLSTPTWDGLGWLHAAGYMDAPGIFFCPAHVGEDTLDQFGSAFNQDANSEIRSNYQYRGRDDFRTVLLTDIEQGTALVSDTFAVVSAQNHAGGVNVLRAGQSVAWRPDEDNSIIFAGGFGDAEMFRSESANTQTEVAVRVDSAWRALDEADRDKGFQREMNNGAPKPPAELRGDRFRTR